MSSLLLLQTATRSVGTESSVSTSTTHAPEEGGPSTTSADVDVSRVQALVNQFNTAVSPVKAPLSRVSLAPGRTSLAAARRRSSVAPGVWMHGDVLDIPVLLLVTFRIRISHDTAVQLQRTR
jgi:hypothetical protein